MNNRARLRDVTSFSLPRTMAAETLDVLREFGTGGCEGLVLWTGTISAAEARIERMLVPPQRAIRGEEGVGYFVAERALVELNELLSREKLRLLAQVHSHPARAYHSDVDDRYALVTTTGGLSIVVPNFGNVPAEPSAWAVYRLQNQDWLELSEIDVAKLLRLI